VGRDGSGSVGVDVLVVGGGIAGMSAATVLVERGVRTTVIEARPTLGGRLAAWPDRLADGTPQMVDHGFHAFFRQYYNWRSVLRRADPALAFLRPVPDYPVLAAQWPTEKFGRLPKRPPVNLLALLARSGSLRLRDLRGMDGRAALPLLAYHPEHSYAMLDATSAGRLLDALRLPDRARAMLFEVFAHSFFNHEQEMSAAEMVANFHFYFLGNPEGLAFDAAARDYDTAIWRPLAAHVRRHGGRTVAGAPVVRVDAEPGGWRAETADGDLHRARHLVLAVDPPALAKLVAASPALTSRAAGIGPTADADPLDGLPTGAPYAVARYWLGGPIPVDRPLFSGVSRQPTLDSITLYHRLEPGCREWARRTGGSVVELHAYACPEGVPAVELAERMRAELATLWPEIADAPVRDLRARVERQAPAFPPGGHRRRPGVRTGVDRLYLAGDGIRSSVPSALMERSAVTGIEAANHILVAENAPTEPIRTIRRRGLLASRGGQR
jgi:isorenieratene synthase